MSNQNIEDPAKVASEFAVQSWEDLEAIEFNSGLLFPETIYRRMKNGKLEEVKIMLKVLRKNEERQARKMAREWAAKDGIDPAVDPDVFDDMDTLCTMYLAIRNTSEPFEPFCFDVQELERSYDDSSISLLLEKYQIYKKKIDPRIDTIDPEQALAVIGAIAARRDVGPLVVYDSDSQANFIVSMVALLTNSLTPEQLRAQFGQSNAEPSPG